MKNEKQNPFTLLELIVATAIFAVFMALMSGVLFVISNAWNMQNDGAGKLQEYIAMERVADVVLRNMVLLHFNDDNGTNKSCFLGDSDRMVTAYRRHSFNPEKSAVGFAAFALRDGNFIVQWRTEPYLYFKRDVMPETLQEEVLASRVESLKFLYAGYENGELTWQTDWKENENDILPLAVAWIITFEDGTKLKFIRRTPGVSYYTSFGKRNDLRIQ